MTSAIFLDVDGVLNSEAFLRKIDEQHRQHDPDLECTCYRHDQQIDRDAITRLNRLVALTGAKIVISSSWRKLLDPPELHRVLVSHGLVAEIIGETPDGPNDLEMLATYGHIDRIFRGHEIDLWLRKHPEVDSFVILDDGSDMEMHTNRLVQTDCEDGLLDDHVDLAIRVLLWDGKTPPYPPEEMTTVSTSMDVVYTGAMADAYLRAPAQPGSSAGLHCSHNQHLREGSCPESILLKRTTAVQPTYEDDYQHLMPALDTVAASLGWCLDGGVWWCPTHAAAKKKDPR